jgi:site-specific recombinase XerD
MRSGAIMKTQTDLGGYLRRFLGEYLPRQRNATSCTIRAYRDALKLLLRSVAEAQGCSITDLRVSQIDRAAVLTFLSALESIRGNGVTTRNHRLAAIRSFFRFVSLDAPEAVDQCAQILAIPSKRGDSRPVDYLTAEEINAVLMQIPLGTPEGRRDDALMRFIYNTGARVQEAVDLKTNDLCLHSPAHVLLRGKGRKERLCPLWPDTVVRLRRLLAERGLDLKRPAPVFTNRASVPLTRFGVRYILAKYVRLATQRSPGLSRKNIHPHTLRHTTAMHLLQSGVDLNTIRCWLGHASVTTTNRYVEIDIEMKRRALDGMPAPSGAAPPVVADASLLSWLESL